MKQKSITETFADVPNKPEPGIIDSFISDWRPESETYTVETPSGAKIVFRSANDRAELEQIKHIARLTAESSFRPFPDAKMAELHRLDKETIALASIMSQLAVEPKLEYTEFLRLAKQAPVGFEYIKDAVNTAQSGIMAKLEERLLAEAKNALSGTPDGQPASESLETAGESTPTN